MRIHAFVQFVLRNLGWMSASIFLALVVWVAANMSNNPVEQRRMSQVPITILLPEGYVLSRPPSVTTAQATIRAQKSEWDLLTADDVLVTADLRDSNKPGDYRVELTARVASPRHGKVVALRPSTLTLTLDLEIEQRVPIRVDVVKEPPLGYEYPADIPCSQTETTVRGSAEKVQPVTAAEVRINLSDERNPVTNRRFDLIPVNELGNTVKDVALDPASVTCSIDIRAREDVIQVRVLADIAGDPPPGYIFEGYVVDPESVGVTGNRSAISELSGLVRTMPVSLTNQTKTFSTDVPVSLPDGVSLVPENQLIHVTVTISAVRSSRQFQEVPVEITGLDPTLYRATLLPNAVTVVVVGPEALLPEQDAIRVTVDLSGIGPGNHQVTPVGTLVQETAPDSMSISVRPEALSVSVEAINPTETPSPTPTFAPVSEPTELPSSPAPDNFSPTLSLVPVMTPPP
jgi:YbbR domain-containing protein